MTSQRGHFTPHPGYRVLWLILHVVGIATCVAVELTLPSASLVVRWTWWIYFGSVLGLELVSLERKRRGKSASGTFSWTVWAFLPGPGPRAGFARIVLVASWCLFLLISFTFRGWTPWEGVNFALGLAFTLWEWAHFFGEDLRAQSA